MMPKILVPTQLVLMPLVFTVSLAFHSVTYGSADVLEECKTSIPTCIDQASAGTLGSPYKPNSSRVELSPTVVVNLESKCMCVMSLAPPFSNVPKCFLINTGNPKLTSAKDAKSRKSGPASSVHMTFDGIGIPHRAEGDTYQTKANHAGSDNQSASEDNDAIAMGIAENDERGKWIHKVRNCNDLGGNETTLGCIAVPCQYWTTVKNALLPSGVDGDGKARLAVCGGVYKGTPSGNYGKDVKLPITEDKTER